MENKNAFICPICGNSNPNSIGIRNGKPYCRACIIFRGDEAVRPERHYVSSKIYLDYVLSPEQQALSDQLVRNYINGVSTLVHAVCGRPKTRNI